MQNKSLMFQVCMVLFMLLVVPVKGLAQGVTISGHMQPNDKQVMAHKPYPPLS